MGELLTYGWAFELWVSFWIIGEILNNGELLNYELNWISSYVKLNFFQWNIRFL